MQREEVLWNITGKWKEHNMENMGIGRKKEST